LEKVLGKRLGRRAALGKLAKIGIGVGAAAIAAGVGTYLALTIRPAKPVEKKVSVAVFEWGFGTHTIADDILWGCEHAGSVLGIDVEPLEVNMFKREEAVTALRSAAESGKYDLIVGCHDGFREWIELLAPDYPDQLWLCHDAGAKTKDLPNVAYTMFKQNEGSFLVGILAAKLTKTKTVGYLGHLDIPILHDFAEGYKAGVHYVDPEIEIIEEYTGDPIDAAKMKMYALHQFERGVDIVFVAGFLAGLGAYEAGREQNKLLIGVDIDQCGWFPDHMVASMLKNVGLLGLTITLKNFQEGKMEFDGSIYIFGPEVVHPCDMGRGNCRSRIAKELVTSEIREMIDDAKKKIVNKEIKVPGAMPWSEYEPGAKKFPIKL